jgi:drug/metabolite transporter (DMT)-like permease
MYAHSMSIKKKDYLTGVLFALINSVSLGLLGIIDKIGTGHFTSSIIFSTQSVTFAFFFVTIFSLLYFKTSFVNEIKVIQPRTWRLIFFIGVFTSMFIIFRFLGLTQSTGTFATLAQVIITAQTALLAAFFLKEKLSKTFWILFTIILIAIYFVSVGKFAITSLQAGDIYILFGTVFIAVANIFSKIVVSNSSPVLLSEGRFFFAAAFIIIASFFIFQQSTSLFVFSVWSVISGFFWAINILAFSFAIQRIGVTFTTSILMIAPVYTMILEYLILKQTFNPIQIVAAIVVIASGILMVRLKNK